MKTRSMYFYISLALALTAPVFAQAQEATDFDPMPTQQANSDQPAKGSNESVPSDPAVAGKGYQGNREGYYLGSGGLIQRHDKLDGNSYGINVFGGYNHDYNSGLEASANFETQDYFAVKGKVRRMGLFLNCEKDNAADDNFCIHLGVSGRGQYAVGKDGGDSGDLLGTAQFTILGRKKLKKNGMEVGAGIGTQAGGFTTSRLLEGTLDKPLEYVDGKYVPGTGSAIGMGGIGAQATVYADAENFSLSADGGWLHNLDSDGLTRNMVTVDAKACAKWRSKLSKDEKAAGKKESQRFTAICATFEPTLVDQRGVTKSSDVNGVFTDGHNGFDMNGGISIQGTFN